MKKLENLVKKIGNFARTTILAGTLAIFTSCNLLMPFLSEKQAQTDYKMAFVIVGDDEGDNNAENIEKIREIKDAFDDNFYYATQSTATMDTSHDVLFVNYGSNEADLESIVDLDGVKLTGEVIKQEGDVFDFISFYPTFETNPRTYNNSSQNRISGIGEKLFNYSFIFGSSGKLLGINVLSGLYNEADIFGKDYALILNQNALLHETGHQWGVFVGENFDGTGNEILGIKQKNMHFYRGLESPYGNTTPMNSDAWEMNADAKTYSRIVLQNDEILKYHPFQLYFMGLLNRENYDFNKKFKIYDAGGADSERDFDFEHATPYREISLNDIIAYEGEWKRH